MRYQAGLTIAAITVAFAAASPARAHTGASRFILRGDVMAPPTGFADMCRTDATFCRQSVDTPPPALGDGRGATGLPAFAMTVTNMIAAVMPNIITRLEKPSTSFRVRAVPRGADLSVVPSLPITTFADMAKPPLPVSFGESTGTADTDLVAPLPSWNAEPVLTAPMPLLVAEPVFDIDPTVTVTAPAVPPVPGTDKRLESVNKLVNGRVRQRSDMQIYATAEHWARSGIGNGAQGDCEDLAIEKRYQLIAQGFDSKRLSFAVVYSRQTKLHTVLIARTDDGDMVLDSDTPWIRRVDQTDYSWVSIQSPDNGMRWQSARL
ncbi:transglutaminase-like cysteine peptidase [Sphingomonas fuzhouensis]|uniref:transglutaminase-like cysteine peptidase n=1 Tax=Sphingomonas fuzhouensis TaxID=3106033 RepID=UPI002AFE1930|nr:transglutaminase-like cysteine peptidase [Sphingomonas sp. SGZ-02]